MRKTRKGGMFTFKTLKQTIPEGLFHVSADKPDMSGVYRNMVEHGRLKDVPVTERTEKLCLEAVKHTGLALEFVIDQTDEICLEAVKQNWMALKLVRNQTDEICKVAIHNNSRALLYVKNKTVDLCLQAILQDAYTLKYVPPSIKENGEFIDLVAKSRSFEPTEDLIYQNREFFDRVCEVPTDFDAVLYIRAHGHLSTYEMRAAPSVSTIKQTQVFLSNFGKCSVMPKSFTKNLLGLMKQSFSVTPEQSCSNFLEKIHDSGYENFVKSFKDKQGNPLPNIDSEGNVVLNTGECGKPSYFFSNRVWTVSEGIFLLIKGEDTYTRIEVPWNKEALMKYLKVHYPDVKNVLILDGSCLKYSGSEELLNSYKEKRIYGGKRKSRKIKR